MEERIKLLVLRITDDCNLFCRYCYARGGESRQNMSFEVAKRALDYVSRHTSSFKVQFSGGEPLLNLSLIKRVISYAEEQGLRITFQLQTNGTLLTPKVVQELKSLRLSLGVSLDGMPEVNDVLRPFQGGWGSTWATVQGLRNLAAQGIRVGVTAVLTAESTKELPRLVELCTYLGNVYGLSLNLVRPLGRAKDAGILPPSPEVLREKVKEALRRAREIGSLGGPVLRFRELERLNHLLACGERRSYYCWAVLGQSLAVEPDGSVYPCASLGGIPEFYLGNIMDTHFSLLRQAQAKPWWKRRVEEMEGCRSCPERFLCGGGCLARSYAYTGRKDRPYLGDCILRKVFVEEALCRAEAISPADHGSPLPVGYAASGRLCK